MELEYNLTCKGFDKDIALQLLKRRFILVRQNDHLHHISLLTNADQNEAAPASIALIKQGFYFVDNLVNQNDASIIFRNVVDLLLSMGTKVEIEDL